MLNMLPLGLYKDSQQRFDRNKSCHEDSKNIQEILRLDGPAVTQVQHHRSRVQREVDESDQESSKRPPSCWWEDGAA